MDIRPIRPTQNPDFLLEELDGELLLYCPGRTQALYLNDTARLLWSLCDGNRTTEEIFQLLEEAYPDSRHCIRCEVNPVLHQLMELGAVSST